MSNAGAKGLSNFYHVFNYLYQEQPTLRDQVYVAFDSLACLPSSVSNLVGEQVIAGLILVMQKQKDIIR